jgi:hypothetical protein
MAPKLAACKGTEAAMTSPLILNPQILDLDNGDTAYQFEYVRGDVLMVRRVVRFRNGAFSGFTKAAVQTDFGTPTVDRSQRALRYETEMISALAKA